MLALSVVLVWAPALARDIKVATWDLGWLTLRPAGDPALPPGLVPYTAADLERLHAYATALRADVVAIQGVDGPDAAARVFPPEAWDVVLTDDDLVLRSGFAVRHGLRVDRHDDLIALEPNPRASQRLRSGADITIAVGATRLRLLSVQLKAGCRVLPLTDLDPACAILARQGRVLGGWIAAREAAGEAFAVLGDFARVLDAPGDVPALLGTEWPVLRATEGRGNPCWGGGAFSDQLLFGGRAAGWVVATSLRAMVFRETDPAARAHLPAHCPVSVHLAIPD